MKPGDLFLIMNPGKRSFNFIQDTLPALYPKFCLVAEQRGNPDLTLRLEFAALYPRNGSV